MNPEIERLIGAGATADKIAEAARHSGMKSLWESGLVHVLNGETTLEELLRVTDVPHDDRAGGVTASAGRRRRRRSGSRASSRRCRRPITRQQRRRDASGAGVARAR